MFVLTPFDEIYLDNAATTQAWPEVIAEVQAAMESDFGNASARHRRGLAAARKVVAAERAIENAVGGAWRVIFTSGGTESDTTAVYGSVPKGKRNGVIATTVDHAAVDEACKAVTQKGGRVVRIGAGTSGVVKPEAVAAAIDDRCALVCVAYVAGEMGTVQPVADIADAVKHASPRCRVHVDAVQALGRLDRLELPESVDTVALSAHKIHGPQGIGALLIRPHLSLRPLLFGGDQQGGIRPGTLNLPGIVGFHAAIEKLTRIKPVSIPRMAALTDKLIVGLAAQLDGTTPLGDPQYRAPGMAVLSFDGVTSEVLLHALEDRGILASAGSACHATRKEPPAVLVDAGLRRGAGAIRFSLSLRTTEAEIDAAISAIIDAVRAVRAGRAGER